ncbi:tyrosine-type recombinase/integrase [Bifidobacterium animalis]|nr:site-specific integrase [Bifidobacterium animalis]
MVIVMPRERIPLGQHGDVWFESVGEGWRALCQYRTPDGKLRKLKRSGKSKEAARRNLEQAFSTLPLNAGGDVDGRMQLDRLAELYLDDAARRVRQSSLAPYRSAVKTIDAGLSGLRVFEATPMVLQRFIDNVVEEHGRGAAKTCKNVLSGMFKLAVRNGAIMHNPVAELDMVRRSDDDEERQADAIPLEGLEDVFRAISTISDLVRNDEVDLLRFMVGTGLRVSEACGLLWDCVYFDTGQISVERQSKRVPGEGVQVVDDVKTSASRRRIHIPSATVDLLRRRHEEQVRDGGGGEHDLVFPLPNGNVREANLLNKHLRLNRDALGYPELRFTSHSFRKTCASILEAQGAPQLAIRDYLGHEDEQLTERVYIARNLHTVETASTLDKWGGLDSI